MLGTRAFAQAPVLTTHTDAPPVELTDAIEALLGTGGDRLTIGAAAVDFWWVKSLPLKSGTTDSAWASVDEGALVGAIKVSTSFKDVRGAAVKPGTYTLRYARQPVAGSAAPPGRGMLLLSPADADHSVSALGHDNVIILSKQANGSGFPAALTLDPPAAPGAARARRRIGRGGVRVTFMIPVSRDGADAGSIRFGLTVIGLTTS